MFPSPFRPGPPGPGLTWTQLVSWLVLAAAIGGGFAALKAGQAATDAKVDALMQNQVRLENKVDRFTEAIIEAQKPAPGKP